MDFIQCFKVRPTNEEMSDWVITIGDKLATNEHFSTQEKAEEQLKGVNWDLVASLSCKMAEVMYNEMNKENQQ